ncbi:MAG TPA: squalene/phytoene synthase family protein [Bacteroidales bacterium]|nr:squalene/phytoene synthase family protein [Bacteroidales bacterium]
MEHQEADQYLEIFHSLDFEKIKDHPNILIAAAFWNEERYRAARTAYKFMRSVDDLIDNYKAGHNSIGIKEQEGFESYVKSWLKSIKNKENQKGEAEVLSATWKKFLIPDWPVESFGRSMIYDIHHNGFPAFKDFLEYAEGACVAPAGIFVHLCGLREADGGFLPPVFDVRRAARSCAVFSYLVHIIRDFQKDRLNHLNYFPDDLLAKYNLRADILDDMAHGGPVAPGFRSLIRFYMKQAEKYRKDTVDTIHQISPLVDERYRLSLHIIFDLYLMVYNRIDPDRGVFTTEALNPTPAQIREQVLNTIQSFDYKPRNTKGSACLK